MRRFSSLAVVAPLWIALVPAPVARAEDLTRESVVKIYASSRLPDPIHPWQKQSPQDASGTGIVIEGKRILTNAHVVNYASQVKVEPNQSGEKYVATVEVSAPGIDLAILKLEDESFFEKRPPLPRAEKLPEIKDAVTVYGYPTGGSSLSITKGIVSRIEFVPYNGRTQGLRIQIDAAINPGNSGGPALVDDKMIGVTFSGIRGADNIGYIIPTEEVDLFLKDVADGTYDGKPMMYDQLQTLENDAVRAKLGFSKKPIGMAVHAPDRDDADYPLKEWDVITKIGDHEVDNVGMVKVRDNLRLRFQYYIQSLTKDGKVPLTIVRDGKEMAVEVPVPTQVDDLIKPLKGKYPTYFVYGPLVFSPATTEFVNLLERNNNLAVLFAAISSPLATRRGDKVAFPGEELVVISAPMFPHRLGSGYSNPLAKVVKEVNGIPVKNLRHLIEILRDATDTYVTISFNDRGSETIVFNRKEALEATDEILSDNGIRQQASDDVLPIWKKTP
ncbi:trypsin-like peptidase domain-containing protein [Tundrisphaera sp. TA3]|uniref:S1C family serine protease n=1 Tax=Tundrisphaera sp. TA3 TaxID=3435775 RepID=UPI003EBD0DFD